MSDLRKKRAKEVFETICKAMDKNELKYQKDENDLTITSGFGSEDDNDIPIHFIVSVDAKREVVCMHSVLPFKMPEDKRFDGAIAVCVANFGMVNGSFDYDIGDGFICFRMAATFAEGTVLSEKAIEYIVFTAVETVDMFNVQFKEIADGKLSLQEFIKRTKA